MCASRRIIENSVAKIKGKVDVDGARVKEKGIADRGTSSRTR
jgi:hypothetical protein